MPELLSTLLLSLGGRIHNMDLNFGQLHSIVILMSTLVLLAVFLDGRRYLLIIAFRRSLDE